MPVKVINADFKHLKKLFIVPENDDKFIEYGQLILDMLYSYFQKPGGIQSGTPLKELEKMFSNIKIPQDPQLLVDIFKEIKLKIVDNSVKVGNPFYIGHMTSAIPYYSIFIEMIISALNQNQVKIETARASTFVEKELIAWIHKLIYDCSDKFYKKYIQNKNYALGNVTLDGTLANLTALLVARNKAFPPKGSFRGVDFDGLATAYSSYDIMKSVVFISDRGHYSIDKISSILGIGRNNVIKIPSKNNKANVEWLENEISQINEYNKNKKLKIKILSIVGIAGTTETGNIDDLHSMQKLSKKCDAYFHVDAAWGGPVLFVDQYRHLFKGIEKADSVTFDSHKLLYLPLSMGMVLFKNKDDLNYLKHNSTYILRPDSRDQGRFSVEGSRPFSALRPWVGMQVFGSEGFKLLFKNAFDLTQHFYKLIKSHNNFEALNDPEIFILNYRFIPSEIQNKIKKLNFKKTLNSDRKIKKINEKINTLNVELHKSIRQKDTSFVSRTTINMENYNCQIITLRAITINPLTKKSMLNKILEEHNNLGTEIYLKYRDSFSSL